MKNLNRLLLVFGLIAILTLNTSTCCAQAGSLDLTFGTNGKVTTAIGSGDDDGYSVAIQSDGKILVAGFSIGTNPNFALVRYNSDGSLDNTFDTDGIVTTAVGSSDDYGHSVAIQSDGKILVAGNSIIGANQDFALVRYNTNGSLDNSFDTDGKVTTATGSVSNNGYSVAIQSDGKILVAGYSYNGVRFDFALVRYNINGSLDPTFDTDGIVTTAIGSGPDIGYSVAIQSDGKILVAGYSSNGANSDFALVRYNSNGSLDNTFDTDGIVTTAIGSSSDEGYSVAIQSDGKILVSGGAYNGANYDVALVRYNTNGSLDNSFDTDGKVTTAIGSNNDKGNSVAIQSDGKILVAGYGANNDFALVRYNTDGSLDNSFDADGMVTTAIGSSNAQGRSVAIQSDGKILVAGETYNGVDYDFALVRYNIACNLSVASSQNNVSCNGGSDGSASATGKNGTSPYTYKWSNNNTTQTITNLTAGTYTVTVKDANGCKANTSVTITQPASALTVSTTGTNLLCNENCNGEATSTPSGGISPYTYRWSNGSTSQNLNSLCTGTYTVTVTDANSCISINTGFMLFKEKFSNGIPAGFTLINNDGLTPNSNVSYVNSAWVEKDSAAISTSWYDPAGQADDWLITPLVTLTSNNILSWTASVMSIYNCRIQSF